MTALAENRASRAVALLEPPDTELKIEPVALRSGRFISISSRNTTLKGAVVPADEALLGTDEVGEIAVIYKKFYPAGTAFNSPDLVPKE
jgi:hypothetical protein